MVSSLSHTALDLLKIASYLETNVLNEDVLRRVLVSASFVSGFQEVVHCGLIRSDPPETGTPERRSYAFAHDELKIATYQRIPEGERGAFHSRIGRSLWASLESDEVENWTFEVIG
jgi:predicted ATPase